MLTFLLSLMIMIIIASNNATNIIISIIIATNNNVHIIASNNGPKGPLGPGPTGP